MIVDWLLYGLIIFGFATVLNNTIFKTKPASNITAWSLTFAIFLLSLVSWTINRYYQQEAISKILYGFKWGNQFPSILKNAVIFSFLFYISLSKNNKKNVIILKKYEDGEIDTNLQNNLHGNNRNIDENKYNYQKDKEDDDKKNDLISINNVYKNKDINKIPFLLLIFLFFVLGVFVAVILNYICLIHLFE